MVLEARGLDVTPSTIERFLAVRDTATAKILTRIFADEIRHVRAGTRWYESRCTQLNINPETVWQHLVRTHYRGLIKPPFNDSARDSAGLTRGYYQALAVP